MIEAKIKLKKYAEVEDTICIAYEGALVGYVITKELAAG